MITLLKHHKNKDEIIKELSDKYKIPQNKLFIDVSDFMAKLKV